jgi:hypothetical protein
VRPRVRRNRAVASHSPVGEFSSELSIDAKEHYRIKGDPAALGEASRRCLSLSRETSGVGCEAQLQIRQVICQ